MALASIALPPAPAERIPADIAARLVGIGNAALLAEPLLGFIASRQCPGHVFIETLEHVPQWAQCASEDRVLASGFHSPLEQQVLRSLLRRKGRVIKVLARYLPPDRVYRSTGEACEPLAQGRRLILNASPATETRTTRASALAHNRLVLALASDHCLHHTSGAVSCQKGKMSSV